MNVQPGGFSVTKIPSRSSIRHVVHDWTFNNNTSLLDRKVLCQVVYMHRRKLHVGQWLASKLEPGHSPSGPFRPGSDKKLWNNVWVHRNKTDAFSQSSTLYTPVIRVNRQAAAMATTVQQGNTSSVIHLTSRAATSSLVLTLLDLAVCDVTRPCHIQFRPWFKVITEQTYTTIVLPSEAQISKWSNEKKITFLTDGGIEGFTSRYLKNVRPYPVDSLGGLRKRREVHCWPLSQSGAQCKKVSGARVEVCLSNQRALKELSSRCSLSFWGGKTRVLFLSVQGGNSKFSGG